MAEQQGILKEEFDKIGVPTVNLIATGTTELVGAELAGQQV